MSQYLLPNLTASLFILTATLVLTERQIVGDIFQESRSLLLLPTNMRENKCHRDVPAIFFQTQQHAPVRGNGSNHYFHRIEVCCDGWTRSAYDAQRCVADCTAVSPNNCRNGFCRAPQHCDCFEEFVRNDRGECVHTCPIACAHGRCYLNGTCVCNNGYSLDPQTRKYCRAECAVACGHNQVCVAPNKCACRDGYKCVADLGCQPICIPDCGHGVCVGPNECECFAGYIKRPQRNVCEAECNLKCENGFCESRYKCTCRAGYRYDDNTTSCLPDCGDECKNGICVAPGLCRCFEGYTLSGTTCVPVCPGGCGYFGNCVEPHVCGCGFTQQRCIHGHCNAAGKCNCAAGLKRFVDACVSPAMMESLVATYEQRDTYSQRLVLEFDALIGRLFKF